MILYFDSYITDIPFSSKFVDANKPLRNSVINYAMPKKIDIAKYTLASYSIYKWSNVLIRYEIDDTDLYNEFDTFILNLFPRAIIMHNRSSTQSDFKKSLNILNSFNDDWIFYAGNNDHPIVASDISHIDKILHEADKYSNKYSFISIPYSHFSEYINLPRKNNPSQLVIGLDSEILDEDNLNILVLKKDGDNSSVQIVNKRLFSYWFTSKDFGDNRIIRTEDVKKYLITHNQLMLIPKKEICAHFDGYSHTARGINEITAAQVPPLFIPAGFFEDNIKISYGYNNYREGRTNINPLAEKYSFEDKEHGTDMKIKIEDIPLFWKGRIKEIDINKKISERALSSAVEKNKSIIENPWKFGNRKLDLSYAMFLLRNVKFRARKLFGSV